MTYYENSKIKIDNLRTSTNYYILAIESSCDETAVAITCGRTIISSVISSQIEIHKRFGGVVPEIASRNHTLAIDNLIDEALNLANLTFKDISVIAVTYGAGLLGALLVGVAYAKALAYSLNLPLIAVNHIQGHISANYIADNLLAPPYICLLASGGHTAIIEVKDYNDMQVLGSTQDDAVGEAFDKVARVLGLPYPGGPEIERLAVKGNNNIHLPRAYKNENHLNFSFSGLKTAIINLVANNKDRGIDINFADVACSFETEAVAVLVDNALEAMARTNNHTIVLAGGVGANTRLRNTLTLRGEELGYKVILPPRHLCTDNAAMIGVAAYTSIANGGQAASLSLDADPNLACVN